MTLDAIDLMALAQLSRSTRSLAILLISVPHSHNCLKPLSVAIFTRLIRGSNGAVIVVVVLYSVFEDRDRSYLTRERELLHRTLDLEEPATAPPHHIALVAHRSTR